MDHRTRITITPGKLSGKPCIRGLRITVYDVLDYLAGTTMQLRMPVLYVAAALILVPAAVRAQATAALEGFVLADSSEAPLSAAEITLPGLQRTARSNDSGLFRVGGLPAGTHRVLVRRFGYAPIEVEFIFGAAERLQRDFLLSPLAVELEDVRIVGAAASHSPRMATFERRRASGFGHFIPRDVLEKNESRRLGYILMMAPGVRVTHAKRGGAAWMDGGRGITSLQSFSYVDPISEGQGAPRGRCYAAVYLDGIAVYRGLEGETMFDLNSIPPNGIQGIEVYSGGAQMPIEINATGRTCGAVVIWTR